MKKMFKILSIFTMIFTMVCVFAFGSATNINASSVPILPPPILTGKIFYEKQDKQVIGNVTVSTEGEISINYQYGFTELLIEVKKCVKYNSTDDTIENATACEKFSDDVKIIHLSGSYVKNPTNSISASKKIHLIDQKFLDYDEIVEIQIYTDFFEKSYSTDPRPALYCNPDAGLKCSTDGVIPEKPTPEEKAKMGKTSDESIKERFSINESDISWEDKNRLIYKGDIEENGAPVTTPLSVGKYDTNTSEVKSIEPNTIIKVSNSKFTGDNGEVQDMIYDDIIPTLMTILLIAAGVSIAVLGYQIVKSADEGQERHEKIIRLRNILIGIGIALLLLFVIGPLSDIVEGILFK